VTMSVTTCRNTMRRGGRSSGRPRADAAARTVLLVLAVAGIGAFRSSPAFPSSFPPAGQGPPRGPWLQGGGHPRPQRTSRLVLRGAGSDRPSGPAPGAPPARLLPRGLSAEERREAMESISPEVRRGHARARCLRPLPRSVLRSTCCATRGGLASNDCAVPLAYLAP